jgi:hypothetical protein
MGWARLLFKQRGKGEKKHPCGRGLRRLSPRGSLSSGFYKNNFISWLKGSWLGLCAIGPFRGCMSPSANGCCGDAGYASLFLPNGPEVLRTRWVYYQGMAQVPFLCLNNFKAWASSFKISHLHTCLSCLCVLDKFPLSSPVPFLPNHFLSPNFQSQGDRREQTKEKKEIFPFETC